MLLRMGQGVMINISLWFETPQIITKDTRSKCVFSSPSLRVRMFGGVVYVSVLRNGPLFDMGGIMGNPSLLSVLRGLSHVHTFPRGFEGTLPVTPLETDLPSTPSGGYISALAG